MSQGMTRIQAIEILGGFVQQVRQEFTVSTADSESLDREFIEALRALGVTDNELTATGWEGQT